MSVFNSQFKIFMENEIKCLQDAEDFRGIMESIGAPPRLVTSIHEEMCSNLILKNITIPGTRVDSPRAKDSSAKKKRIVKKI